MSKRTRKDEEMLDKSKKLVKQVKDENETDRLKVSVESLSHAQLHDLLQEIEEYTIKIFARYPKITVFSFSAWTEIFGNNDDKNFSRVADPFKHIGSYVIWLRGYLRLLSQNPSNIYQRFGRDWLKKEISRFLGSIVTAWNESHSNFVMRWEEKYPFSLIMDKLE